MSLVHFTRRFLKAAAATLLLVPAATLHATPVPLQAAPGITWQKQAPASVPPARSDASMAYDATHGVVVMFGGAKGSSYQNDTWTFDGTTWTQQNTAAAPPARIGASMAFDPSSGKILLFGGYSSSNTVLGDTWLWDGTNWTQQSPASSPSPRYYLSMTGDLTHNNVLLFGGVANGVALGDTWTWSSGNWTRLSPATVPPARDGGALAYNPADGTVTLFAGEWQADTWTWNGTTWTQQHPTTAPSSRLGSGFVYDPKQGGLVLFGGFDYSSRFQETWLWKGSTWTLLQPGISPSSRVHSSMTYDAALGAVVLFGGDTGSANSTSDTWVFDSSRYAAQTTPVGSSAAQITIPFQITGNGTLPALSNAYVLTQGTPGLDFQLGTGSTCTGTVASGSTCIINVTFAPTVPGQRMGAVTLADSTGATLATTLVSGTGTGPQVVYPSKSAPVTFGNGMNQPTGIAVDAAGDVFVADYGGSAVRKLPYNNGVYGTPVVLASGLNHPASVAVDGAGNVFFLEYIGSTVKEIPYSDGQYGTPVVVASGLSNPFGVAVDGAGNLFVANYGGNTVRKIPFQSGSYGQPITLGSGFSNPMGIAVDAAGNVFVADHSNNALKKIAYSYGSYGAPTTINIGHATPSGVAVDAAGNLYFSDEGNRAVIQVPYSAGSYGTPRTLVSNILSYQLSVDAAGNVYVADYIASVVDQVVRAAAPSLQFADTASGATSSDSPKTVSLQNIGNADLTFPVPTTGSNPNISANFYLNGNGSTACPQVTSTSSSPTTLATGASCDLVVSFTPDSRITMTSNVSGSLVATDNNLNVNGSQQTLALSGKAIALSLSPSSGTLASITSGQSYSLTFTASGATAPYTYSVSSGSLPAGLSLSSGGVLSGTPTASGSYSFSITATDANGVTGNQTYALSVVGYTTTTTVTGEIVDPTYSSTANEQIVDVTVAGSNGTPTGTVNVSLDGGSAPSYALSNGAARFAYTALAPGSHTVVASYVAQGQYLASTSTTYTFTISKATATVTLGSLNQTYAGQPLSATATTNPAGLGVTLTYNGLAGAPTVANAYAVVATVNDTNYQGTATGTLVIGKATPTVSATPSASAITYGQSLASSTLIGGAATFNSTAVAGSFAFIAPTTTPDAGTANQAVLFTPIDTVDFSTVNLSAPVTVNKATATVTLGSLSATYDGNPHGATVGTTPAGLTVAITYNGSATAPTAAGNYAIAATVNGPNYAGSATGTLTIAPGTAAITFAVPNHTYGDAPVTLAASSSATGAFSYTVVSGPATINGNTLTLRGAGIVTLRALQAADANYSSSLQTTTFTISPAVTVVAFPQPASVVFGTALGATQLNATATATGIGAVPGSFTYTPAAGTVLGSGITTLTAQFMPSNPANFTTPVAATTSLTVSQAPTTAVVTTSASPVLERVAVTFTANVKTTTGGTVPVGTITFLDGQTTLGTATLNASGVASYTVANGFIGAGNHTITATYTGNANQAASSGSVVQAIGSASTLRLTDAGQSSYAVTVQRGFAAQTTVTVTPGATFAGTISFSCSGLPANVSCEFTPSSITLAQGSGAQNVGLLLRSASLQTASLHAPRADEGTGSRLTLAFALPGMLLAGLASRSRRLRGSQRLMLALVCVAGLAIMAGLTGCGSGGSPLYSTTNAAPGTYTFNVVATSGSTTSTLPVTLTIQ